jgi:hypothetical protein
MSDHADTIREVLTRHASFPFTNGDARAEAFAALHALVAERDEARRKLDMSNEYHRQVREIVREAMGENLAYVDDDVRRVVARAEAAEAEAARLREALQTTRAAWDAHMETCPQPPLLVPGPTPDDILRWLNAPSDTASAAPSTTGGDDE